MSPTFSIIVPVFNVESYLEEAIDSLLWQTYDDFEIILVNDGSTDSSGNICKEYKENNENIILIEQNNKGLSEARNTGRKNASGKFIYYFDSDDVLDKNSLMDWYNIFRDSNVDIILFEGEPFGIENKSLKYKRSEANYNKTLKSNDFLYDSKINETYTPIACLFVVKNHIANINEFYPNIIHEDELYYAKLLLRKPLNVYVSPNAYFRRRLRPNSIMTKKKSDKNYYGYERALIEILSDDKILRNRKTVSLIINDLIRQMCKIAAQVDGKAISFKKRISLLRIFKLILKKKLFSKTCIFCLFPDFQRYR